MDFKEKTKGIIGTIGEITGDFIYDRKCDVRIAKLCADMKKLYERLGRLTYRKVKGFNTNDDEFDALIERLGVLKAELAALRDGSADFDDMTEIVFEDGEPADNADK